MTEEAQTVETTEQPKAEPAAELESQATQEAQPAGDQPDEFDKDRAMETIHKLREIEKQSKKDAKELARLKAEEQKRIEASMTEQERLQKERDELAKESAQLKADIMRRDVIAETGLPPQLADRLKGETLEELKADAEGLLKLLPKTKSTQSVTNPANASNEETEAQMRERLYGQGIDVFDVKSIKAKGGGVFWDK
jgi:hypothetical protein